MPDDRKRAQDKISEFSNTTRGVLGTRAALRTLPSLGAEGEAEISIRATPVVNALLSCAVALTYDEPRDFEFCKVTAARAGSASGTHSRTFASACGIGVSRVVGTIGEGFFEPEDIAVAIAPVGGITAIPIHSGGQDASYAEFWADVASLEDGTLARNLLSRRAWSSEFQPATIIDALERLADHLLESSGAFWRDWLLGYSTSNPLDLELCFDVNLCVQYHWKAANGPSLIESTQVAKQKLKDATDLIYDRYKMINKIRNKLCEVRVVSKPPGFGHNSGQEHPKKEEALEGMLSDLDEQVQAKPLSRKTLVSTAERLRRLITTIGDLVADVARDYAKDTLKYLLGASALYVAANWPEIHGKLEELMSLLNELVQKL